MFEIRPTERHRLGAARIFGLCYDQPNMLGRSYLALLLLPALSAPGHATVWQRQRADGNLEFTNAPTPGPNWRAVPESEATRTSARPHEHVQAASRIDSVMWTRDRADGVSEFTNLPPVGRHWKVLFRIGRARPRRAG